MAKSRREKQLESIILDIAWMSRRYADGRQTYAVSMYNDAIELAVKLGLPINPDPIAKSYFAQDGDPRFPKKEMPSENTIDEETGC